MPAWSRCSWQPITTIEKFGRESRPLCIVTEGLIGGELLSRLLAAAAYGRFLLSMPHSWGGGEHYCSDEGLWGLYSHVSLYNIGANRRLLLSKPSSQHPAIIGAHVSSLSSIICRLWAITRILIIEDQIYTFLTLVKLHFGSIVLGRSVY